MGEDGGTCTGDTWENAGLGSTYGPSPVTLNWPSGGPTPGTATADAGTGSPSAPGDAASLSDSSGFASDVRAHLALLLHATAGGVELAAGTAARLASNAANVVSTATRLLDAAADRIDPPRLPAPTLDDVP